MISNKDLYAIAKKYIGTSGKEARAFCGLSSGQPWCNAYVDFIAAKGGVSDLYFDGSKQTYCPTSIKWCKNHLAQIPIYIALPMDIIYFDWENNGTPNHIGFAKAKKSTSDLYTHEGNTSGGIVAEKARAAKYVQAVFRPHFAPEGLKREKLAIDGSFGYQSIYMLQIALGISADGILGRDTLMALQKTVGVAPDADWGSKTSKAIQKMVGVKQDGEFGEKSVKALQTWINGVVTIAPTPTPTKSGYGGAFPTLPITVKKYLKGHATSSDGCVVNAFQNLSKWKYVLRPNDSAIASKMAKCCKDTCTNNNITYSKPNTKANTMTYHNERVRVGEPSNITKKVMTVCTPFMAECCIYAGVKLSYYVSGTSLRKNCKSSGKFAELAYKSGMELKVGDIILTASGSEEHGIMIVEAIGGTTGCLSKGSKGAEVTKLQNFLKWYGEDVGKVDADFGTKTYTAVKAFQTKEGLTVDGEFGPASLARAKTVTK